MHGCYRLERRRCDEVSAGSRYAAGRQVAQVELPTNRDTATPRASASLPVRLAKLMQVVALAYSRQRTRLSR